MKLANCMQISAAIIFGILCLYSVVNLSSYPPPIYEKIWTGPIIKLGFSTPGIIYSIFLVRNWLRENWHV